MENPTNPTRADRFPPETWPAGATPTDAQLVAWVASMQPGDDPRIVADVLKFRLDEKAAYMLEARALVDRADDARSRYRLAWHSARRRARFATDVVDAEILCGSVDHGWDCGLPDGHQGPHCGHPPGVRSW
jgi:hypothetical protein